MNLHHWEAGYLFNQFWINTSHLRSALFNFSNHSFFLSSSFLIGLGIIGILLLLIRKVYIFIRSLKEKSVLLEITPPSITEKTAYTTKQLFSLIHDLGLQKGFLNYLMGKKTFFSFEIVSTRSNGIRYLIRTTESEENTVKKHLLSYLPQVKVKKIEEYLNIHTKTEEKLHTEIIEFKLKKHFAYPLQKQNLLEEHDPVAYITGMMTKLKPSELISFQVILSPIQNKEVIAISSKNDEDLLNYLGELKFPWYLAVVINLIKVIATIGHFILGQIMWAISELRWGSDPKTAYAYHAYEQQQQMQVSRVIKMPRVLNSYEQETARLIREKINQPLFETTIRFLVTVKDKKDLKERIKGIKSTLSNFSVGKYQALVGKRNFLFVFNKIRLLNFKKRLLSLINNQSRSLLSVSEISDLYHFPYADITKTEGLVKSRSRQLPAPLSLKKSNTDFDVVIGINQYGGEISPIGLTLEQRQKHMYVIGKTGMGKTTLLTSSIYQDMVNGKGLAVLDPHGDMIQELLKIVPKNRKEDVIFFDPSDREWPIGLNLLSPGIKFSNVEDERDWITSSVLAIFKKLADEQYWGPRMEHILRNATLTALLTPNPNLYTLQRLLTDKTYQKKVALTLKDPVLRQFWQKEFALMGNMQVSSVTAPLTQRLGSFISTNMSRNILLQEKSCISISQIMDTGKILLVNLSKGDLGEDQSFFFGTILTSFIWMAAYQRTKIPESKRRDFFLYVDEFQNFATPRFSEITSEGRKFHVSLIASHQNIAQVKDKDILKVVAGNANTIVCLKSSPDDEQFILPFMDPEVEKGDIVNLAPFNFFMKVSGEESEDAFSGKTVPIDVTTSEKIKDEIINYTRKNYATPRIKVEKYLEKLFTQSEVSISSNIEKQPKKVAPKKSKGQEKIATKEKIKKIKRMV